MSGRAPMTPGASGSVLFVDSDPTFLEAGSRLVAAEGHRAWGAEDLIAAASFLADQAPDLLVIELAHLEIDGADPLGDLRARAPLAPTVVTALGPPGEAFRALNRAHDIFGYHDKRHGEEGLRLWLRAAIGSALQRDALRRSRRGLHELVVAVPELHSIQSLDEVQCTILEWLEKLLDSDRSFVATRKSDPVGKPPIEGFGHAGQTIDDYVVGATNVEGYAHGATVDAIKNLPMQLMKRAVEEGNHIVDAQHGVLPLSLGEHVLGLAYLEHPKNGDHDYELLQLFGSQAAAAIRNAALYEWATIDATTRVFQKAFTLDRLRESINLAYRKAFPVSVLMLDIDHFKALNDRHGHIVGDRALRHLGALLKANLRDSDIVGRFGGDEFLVILLDANQEGTEIAASRLSLALERDRARRWPSGVPPLSVSTGMATLEPGDDYQNLGFPDFPAVAEALVAEADSAMYAARRDGKERVAARRLCWADFAGS